MIKIGKNMNKFLEQGENLAYSFNGSLKAKALNNSFNPFLEQFANISKYRQLRDYADISNDMQTLWDIDKVLACKFVLYMRMITRETNVMSSNDGEKIKLTTQTGAGLKHEAINRMFWVGVNHWEEFEKLLPLFISVGSWKDLFQLWRMDIAENNMNATYKGIRLYWDRLLDLVKFGLRVDRDMVVKYLPAYVCRKKQTTALKKANSMIAKYIMQHMWPQSINDQTGKVIQNFHYRKLKNGKTYDWQVKISQELYDSINFDTISGRALMLLTNGKFLENHGLEEKFYNWIKGKKTAKYKGYVYELFANYRYDYPQWKKYLINKQFETLLADGDKSVTNLLVVIDASGSMKSNVPGTNVTSYIIAKSMALYFSYSLKGTFANSFACFSNNCELYEWNGENPTDKWESLDNEDYYGNTNFQSVIDMFIRLKNNGVPEKDFPKGILCLSDGEFDRLHNNTVTNFEYAISRLEKAGFTENYIKAFRIILWDIPNDFYGGREDTVYEGNGNFIYMSGYDINLVKFIFTGKKGESTPLSTEKVFENAMNQEVLSMVDDLFV